MSSNTRGEGFITKQDPRVQPVKMEATSTTNAHPKKMHDNYEDEEERKHFQRIVAAFKYYK